MANLTNAQKEKLKLEFVKYVDSQTVEDIIRDKKSRETLLRSIILNESISIAALKILTEYYREVHKNNSEALDESFEKLAVLAVLAGKTEKIIPKELVPYMAFHVGFAEENPTQELLNDNNNSNLQNFAYAFRIRLNSKIIKENDTPLQNRRFDALGRLIQYNSQCSAVCFDGKQILVAFNELHNSSVNTKKVEQIETHTTKVFKYLQDYTTHTALPKEEQKNFLQQQNLSTQRKELLLDAAQYYYKNNSDHKDILPRILQELEKYPNNNQEVQQEVCKVTGASPKVVKAVARARRDLMKLEDALNPDIIDASKKFAPSIIEAIKQPYKIVLDGPLSDKAHAEMRIIQYIKEQLQVRDNQLSEEIYIGLSKLCCISCDLVINKETKNVNFHFTDKNKQKHLIPLNITTRGGNGVGYEWALIDAIRKNPKWLEDFLGKTAYEKYNTLSEQEKKIAINGIVRYIGKGELKIKDTPLKINPKKEQRKDKENEPLKKQRQKKLTADTSSSEAEEKNEPREKIIAAAIYDSTFPAAQIQPIISTTQPNVSTTLDSALEEIKKLQADLVHAQENTLQSLSANELYQKLLVHPDISLDFLQRLISEKQQLNKKKNDKPGPQNDPNLEDKKNAYNQRISKPDILPYLYQYSDFDAISPQLIDKTKVNFKIFVEDQNSDQDKDNDTNIKNIQNEFPLLDKPIIGIYNIPGGIGHWTSFAILKDEKDQVVLLYKDSMGGDCPKDIQKAAEMYSNGQTVKPIVNNSKEQGGHLTNKGVDVNCGIYALKNAEIIYKNIIDPTTAINFIHNFNEYKFSSREEADEARKNEFAKKYVIGTYNKLLNQELQDIIKPLIHHRHESELKSINNLLNTTLQSISTSEIAGCEILDYNSAFSITKHNEPKLYLELSNIQQESEKYKYEYHISTPMNYAETAEKFLQNSNFNIEKKQDITGGVRYIVTSNEIEKMPTWSVEDFNDVKKAHENDDLKNEIIEILPAALNVDLSSLVEIKEIINAEERKKKEQLKAGTKLNQDIVTPSDSTPNQDTQTPPQKLSTLSHDNSNSEEELVINRRNWLNISSFQPPDNRAQSSLLQSPQDTPSSIAINDIESDEMSSTPNSIEELQSRSSSSSQDLLSRNSSEEELVFNRNNIIFDLSSSNTNTDKIKRDNDDVKNDKNELLSNSKLPSKSSNSSQDLLSSSSSEQELIFNRSILPIDIELPSKNSSINTNKRKHSSSENEELTLGGIEDESPSSNVEKQSSKKPKATDLNLPKNLKFSNLTRLEKENLTNLLLQEELNVNGKYNLTERLAAVNDNKEVLNKFDREAVITANIDFKAIDTKEAAKIGSVEIRVEHNHLTDHTKNTQTLISEIQNGRINKNTVIAIERKQYGENLGMKDVIKIATILEYNEKNPDIPIKLPVELENTPILQDAILYKTAKEKGIKIISLEGKNLEHLKNTPLYNENREQYMTDVINEIRGKGYNVIASVGSSHVINLEKNLENSKKHDIGFSHIPRKILQKALNIGSAVPTGMVNIKASTKGNSMIQRKALNSKLKRNISTGR
ncbi:hypothetical protein H6P87_00856 [Rickettsia tillamookensis]|uniref:Ubiquitin-like protease family profile domain-containing protein n=1 Tax=Rickettsia tillamookensis TaxID=2761623 RepID=A0A9E6MHT7_9RICK|nr:hypothetical protein H6P87_00856 [Rickettsia tillamookensis]